MLLEVKWSPISLYPSSGQEDGLKINAGGGDFFPFCEWKLQLIDRVWTRGL